MTEHQAAALVQELSLHSDGRETEEGKEEGKEEGSTLLILINILLFALLGAAQTSFSGATRLWEPLAEKAPALEAQIIQQTTYVIQTHHTSKTGICIHLAIKRFNNVSMLPIWSRHLIMRR